MKRNNKFQELKSSIKGSLNLKLSQENIMSQRKEIIEKDSVYNIYYIMGNFHNYYQEFEVLGEGCVGLVKKVRKISTGEYFACKTVKLKDEETVMQVIREFKKIKELNHPNIVKMYELYVDEVRSRIYTIMELVQAREMFEVIRKLGSYSEEIASKIFKQILSSIRYMHEQLVCHRDLKPNNILATEDGLLVKITDFNISKFGMETKKDKFQNKNIKMWTYTGTVSFSAPEVFSECEYDQQVDIWSAGVVLYTMLSGQEPFQAEYLKDLIHKIQTANYSFPSESWDHVSEEAKDLIRKCLILNPLERITPEQALLHPWITGKQNTSPLTLIFFNNFENNARRLSKQVNAYEKLGLIKIQERKKSVDSSILRQHQFRQFYIKHSSNSSTTSTNVTKDFYDDQNQNQQQIPSKNQQLQQSTSSQNGDTDLISLNLSNQNSGSSSPYTNSFSQLQQQQSHNSQFDSLSQICCYSPTIKNLCKLTESIEENDSDCGVDSPSHMRRSPRNKKHHKTLIIHDRYRLSEQDKFIIQQNEIIAACTNNNNPNNNNIVDEIIDSQMNLFDSNAFICDNQKSNHSNNNLSKNNLNSQASIDINNNSIQNSNNKNNNINNSNINKDQSPNTTLYNSMNVKPHRQSKFLEQFFKINEETSSTSFCSTMEFQSTQDVINSQSIRSKFCLSPQVIENISKTTSIKDKSDTSISPQKKRKIPKNNTCILQQFQSKEFIE